MPKKGTKKGVTPIGTNLPVNPLESETIDIMKERKNPKSPIPLFPKFKK